VSASEHGRAQAIIQQLQARISEMEEELTDREEPEMTISSAVTYLLGRLPQHNITTNELAGLETLVKDLDLVADLIALGDWLKTTGEAIANRAPEKESE
jgi:hypothetical protein